MNVFTFAIILGYISFGESYTKYGRSCKDIGCPSNQRCVMETDPCSYYQRQGECGSYPTCKRDTNSAARTCATYVCPPTKVCRMDGDTPKCVDDHSKVGLVGYDTQSQNVVGQQHAGGSNIGSQSSQPTGNLYPSIPKGETTPRSNVYRQPVGGGYQGGQVGSGYPGQQNANNRGGYPQQAGYPSQGGYPQQGYPQQGYPQPGYPQGQGRYPNYPGYQQGGYQQGGYQQAGYPQGGYPQGGNQQGYGRPASGSSSGNSFTDQITSSLKSIGTNFLKNALSNALSGKN